MSFSPDNPDEAEDLTEKELKFGYWWTSHRLQIRQGLIIALIVFDAVFLGYSLFKWGMYLGVGYWADKRMVQEIARPAINYIGLREHFSAQPLAVVNTYLFPGRTKADAVAIVKNPNERFFVSFDYDFDLGGFKTPLRHGFLLPGEEKPLADLGIEGAVGASSALLELKNVSWQRISNHTIKDMIEYIGARLNFGAADVNFTPAKADSLRQSRLTFSFSNESSFNYYEPRFLILLESGGNLVGLEQVVFNQFLAGEKKNIDLRLFNQNVFPSNIRVMPDINIFDPKAYIL